MHLFKKTGRFFGFYPNKICCFLASNSALVMTPLSRRLASFSKSSKVSLVPPDEELLAGLEEVEDDDDDDDDDEEEEDAAGLLEEEDEDEGLEEEEDGAAGLLEEDEEEEEEPLCNFLMDLRHCMTWFKFFDSNKSTVMNRSCSAMPIFLAAIKKEFMFS